MSERRVAFVAGASRGIGRGCAIHLARAGFDVAIGARTLGEGTGPGGLPGSLESVAREVEAEGGKALVCRVDLRDRAGCSEALERTLETFGRIDTLVNSAIDYGSGRLFVDTPIEEYDGAFEANVTGPLHLIQQVVPVMRRQGGGLVINVSSGAGQNETQALPGAGGWPLLYSITKAAINRATAGLAKELRADGIAVLNLEPGVVVTERMRLITSQQGIDGTGGVTVDVPGLVCAHLATHPTPMAFSGRTVDAPQFSVWAGLVDGAGLPHPYGPTGWGAPPAVAIAGQASGVESGVPTLPGEDA